MGVQASLRLNNATHQGNHRLDRPLHISAAFGNVCPDQLEGRHERLTDRRADHVGGGLPVASNSNRPSTSAAPPDGQRIGVRSGTSTAAGRRQWSPTAMPVSRAVTTKVAATTITTR